MYEGYLQHDAQEVMQCILGYIQEACDTIRKEQEPNREDGVKTEDGAHLGFSSSVEESKTSTEDDGQVAGKRKSDTEVGNAKKKPKSVKSKTSDAEEEMRTRPFTRSKRRSSSDIVIDGNKDGGGDAKDEGVKKLYKEEEQHSDSEEKGDKTSKKAAGKRTKKTKLSWLRPSGKQPSIFSKFRSVGKISCTTVKIQNKPGQENGLSEDQSRNEKTSEEQLLQNMAKDKKPTKCRGMRLK